MARQALGIAGGVIGAYFGGPVGAQIGFAIGSTIGGYIDPEKIQGPKLGEVPVQTGRDGVPIPYGWGIIHTAGNIVAKNPIVEVEQEEKQGKGGGTTVVNTRRFRTFAIGVCRGPARSIRRIWENDKLVYDKRETPAIPLSETNTYGQNITIYLGDDDQLPDPELEANWGVGTTPAFRGLVYVVWNNYDITDFGSVIPQYRFEIEIDGSDVLTSRIYPVEAVDEIQLGIQMLSGSMDPLPNDDFNHETTLSQAPVLADVLKTVGPENDDFNHETTITDVVLGLALLTVGPENDDFNHETTVTDVELTVNLVRQTMVPEKLLVGISAPTGSMTSV